MLNQEQTQEILQLLNSLPPEKVIEVKDFVLFLQSRYGQPIDESTVWTEEDLQDIRMASLHYADNCKE